MMTASVGTDQGRPDLGHRFDDDLRRGRMAHLEVPLDVLHVHNGVVHQQAQRHDQSEQRQPVDRVNTR